jgi:hypothetical protein
LENPLVGFVPYAWTRKTPDEVADQVLLMDKIYKSAHDVLVWLGNPPAGIDNVAACLEQLPSIAKKMELNVAQLGPSFIPSPKTGLPPSNDPVWDVIMDILHKDWYQRVWTLQEAVLAKRLVVYYGTNILDWELVVKLYSVCGAAPLMPLRYLFDENERDYQPIRWIQTYRKRLEKKKSIDFAHLLWTCGFKQCTERVDRIYGMLGMVDDSIRKNIIKKCPGQERQAFLDAFRAAVLDDPQLHLLSLCFDRGDTVDFPTWCPNLTRRNGCVQLASYYVGKRPSDATESSIVRLSDSDYLKIRGLQVDRISSIVDSQYPSHEIKDIPEHRRLLAKFRDETLQLTQSVYQTGDPAPEQYRRTLIADVPRSIGGRKWSDEEVMTAYKSYLEVDLSQSSPRAHLTKNEIVLSNMYQSLVGKACAGRRYIATVNGRVGLAPAKCQLGDVICVFLGACALHVLRPDGADAGAFSFIGDCYVDGLMNSEALDMLEEGRLEPREFTIK